MWPAVWAIKFGFPPSLFASTSGVTTAHLAEDLSIHWSGRKVIPRKSPTFFDFQHTSRRKSLQLTCGLPPNRRWKAGSGFGCTPLLKFQHTSAYHQVLRNVENPPRQLENSKKHGFRFSDFLGHQTPWELLSFVPISMDFLGQKTLGQPMVCLFGHGTDRLAIEILLYTWRFRMLDTSVYPINAGSYGKSPCLMGLNRYIMVYLFWWAMASIAMLNYQRVSSIDKKLSSKAMIGGFTNVNYIYIHLSYLWFAANVPTRPSRILNDTRMATWNLINPGNCNYLSWPQATQQPT